jgi:hypothetical protein
MPKCSCRDLTSCCRASLRGLYLLQITCVQTTEFVQGKQTRWGLAWTYDQSLPAALMVCTALACENGPPVRLCFGWC